MITPPIHPESTAQNRRGLMFVFGAGVLWSTVGLGIRLIEDATVWQILFYRSISLTLLLYIVIRWRTGRDPFALVWRAGLAGAIAALSLVFAYSGAIFSMQTTSVANAMLLFATAPFMAAVLGWIVLRERVRGATWIAVLIAIGGIAVMVSDQTGAGTVLGSLAALGSALGFACFTVALRAGKSVEMLPAVFLSGLFALVMMGSICLFTGDGFVLSRFDGGIALGMGVFQVGAGLVLFTLGSRSLPAAELALLSLAEVVLGPVWVWLFLGETVGLKTLIGGGILLAAIAGNALSGIRRKPPPIITP
ncbi:MAG: DMT family transporter [Alphaproteobacteria bacterium]|nr:DMT family transporter [Alphaproteobacteria bacterium]